MPPTRERNGNGIYMHASFDKAHGAQPQGAELTFELDAEAPRGKVVALLTGGSSWKGRTQNWQRKVDNSSGITTQVRCVDVRDDLFDKIVFGKINTIDDRTGEVYSGVEAQFIPNDLRNFITGYEAVIPGFLGGSPGFDRPIPGIELDTANVLVEAAGYASSEEGEPNITELGYGENSGTGYELTFPGELLDVEKATGPVYPRDLLDWLCYIGGFKTAYTPGAFEILKETNFGQEEAINWRDSKYNIFNIDWSNGVKVGAAIQQVADVLGLVFSPTDTVLEGDVLPQKERPADFDTLRFYVMGENANPDFDWDLVQDFANHDIGEAVQPDVDTGVWIVGEEDRYELQDQIVVPAWNQKYNRYKWDIAFLKKDIDDINVNQENNDEQEVDIRTSTISEFAAAAQSRDINAAQREAFNDAINNDQTLDEAQQAAIDVREDMESNPNPWLDTGFLEGRKFEDMTIAEYIDAVPFKVHRLQLMEKVLQPDEYTGEEEVRRVPLATPLNTDPTKDYLVRGRLCRADTKKLKKLAGIFADQPSSDDDIFPEIMNGHRLIQSTGHLVFNSVQYKLDPKDDDGEPEPDKRPLDWDDILPDDKLCADVVFLGDPYRTFWGTDERVGTRSVSNLRRRFWIGRQKTKAQADLIGSAARKEAQATATAEGLSDSDIAAAGSKAYKAAESDARNPILREVILDGEKRPDSIAEDVAQSIITRQRVVRSGRITFEGAAGHEPDELFRRVTVNIDATSGIVENVTYSDDEPDLGFPSYWEIQNKIAVENRVRELEMDKKKAELSNLRRLIKLQESESLRPGGPDALVEAAIQNLNKDNWIRVVVNEDAEDTGRNYDAGEPIIASVNDEQQYEAVLEKTSIAKSDTRFIGISAVKNDGGATLAAVTQGVVEAKVKGRVRQGQYLNVTKEGETLEVASGPVLALQTTPDAPDGENPQTYVQKIRVKIGNNQEAIKKVDYALTAADLVIDENDPPNPDDPDVPYGLYADAAEGTRINSDGHPVEDGDVVLTSNQKVEYQSVWIVNESGAWTDMGKAPIVAVRHGGTLARSFWDYWKPLPNPPLDPDPEPYYVLYRSGWF